MDILWHSRKMEKRISLLETILKYLGKESLITNTYFGVLLKNQKMQNYQQFISPETDTIKILNIDKEYHRVSFSPISSPTYSSHLLSASPTHFSGSGADVKFFTATGTGLRIFTISHTGSGKFAIWLKDSSGKEVALLVNDIGSYSGKESVRLASGSYYLNITADGAWTIDISST